MIDIFFGENAIWFSAVALAGTGIFALRLLLMLVGVGDVDGGDVELAAEGDPSLGFLSLNGMAGIMMGFGYGALIAYRSLEFGFVASIGIGVICGLAVSSVIIALFRSMSRLESSGTVDASGAIGNSAAVYTAIPKDPNGRGRVRVIINGRMRYYPARSESGEFPRGAQVRIQSMDDDRTVVVEDVSHGSTPDEDERNGQ